MYIPVGGATFRQSREREMLLRCSSEHFWSGRSRENRTFLTSSSSVGGGSVSMASTVETAIIYKSVCEHHIKACGSTSALLSLVAMSIIESSFLDTLLDY